jgi:predicted aspartyl protease
VSAVRHLLLFACSAILGFISISCLNAQEFGKPSVSPTIPFELVSGFLVVVNGEIGDLHGLKFILDTGATHSLIDRTVADKLRVQRSAGQIMNFDRLIPVDWADIPELRVGPMRSPALKVMVVKLAEYSELAEHADGIIGLDVLSRTKKFSIDYERRVLFLQLPETGSAERPLSACFVIPLVVQGVTIHLAVDTGLQGILLYKNKLRKRLPKLRVEGESTTVTMGRLRGTQVRLVGARIAGEDVGTTFTLINDTLEDDLSGVDGIVGTAFFHAKRIEFDFDAGVLRWQ